jgi:hypothetical protein
MTHAQFQTAALDVLKNYWRIKAANALYRSTPHVAAGLLEYANVPAVGVVANLLTRESAVDAMTALQDFVLRRLPRDLLFALIAEFESRVSARLVSFGESGEGMLGELQRDIQAKVAISADLIADFNEVRVRRNELIHHGDIAGPKYVAASAAVLPRAHPHVKAAILGDNVSPTDSYLAYAADVLVRYSNAIG